MKKIMSITNAQNLRAATEFQAVGDVRYYLNGVCIIPSKNILVATNGHVLKVYSCDFYLIEGDADSDSDTFGVAVFTLAPEIRGKVRRCTATFSVVEGKFPDYEVVFDAKDNSEDSEDSCDDTDEDYGLSPKLLSLVNLAFPLYHPVKIEMGGRHASIVTGESELRDYNYRVAVMPMRV